MMKIREILGATQLALSATVLAVGMGFLLTSAAPLRGQLHEGFVRCEYAGQNGLGPCDADREYFWEGECYDDDGCYYMDETCCD